VIRVYIAGPIGANDDGRRARIDAAIGAGARLLAAGLAPFVPHLWAGACNADGLATYERWMAYDESFLRVCQALLRLPGVSPGADREVAYANALGIPVFHDEGELVGWFRGLRPAWAVAR
jgi:hypothetical protein